MERVAQDVPGRGEVGSGFNIGAEGARVTDASVGAGFAAEPPDVRLTTDYPTAVAIALGKENAQIALARGRLRLGGDIETLVRRADTLAALDDATARLRAATTYPSPY